MKILREDIIKTSVFLKVALKQKNKIYEKGGVAHIELYDRDGNVKATAKFDKKLIDKVKEYQWYSRNGGVMGNIKVDDKRQKMFLHRYLMEAKPGFDIDHIDRDTLNNTCKNLRSCTHKDNTYNRSYVNHQDYPGIKKTVSGTFRTRITHNGKTINLGHFKKLDEAIKARLKAEKKYFGKFAPNAR